MVLCGRFHHQRSLLREQGLTLGLTEAGEYGKSMHEPSHQQLVFLHPLSSHFNVLFFLQYGHFYLLIGIQIHALLTFSYSAGKENYELTFFLSDYQIADVE